MALQYMFGFKTCNTIALWKYVKLGHGDLFFKTRIRPPPYMERQSSPQNKYMAAPEGNLHEKGRLLCLVPAPVSGQGGVKLAFKNLWCGSWKRTPYGPAIHVWFYENKASWASWGMIGFSKYGVVRGVKKLAGKRTRPNEIRFGSEAFWTKQFIEGL